jgi:transcriptional regulator with XRE-family HTH domain
VTFKPPIPADDLRAARLLLNLTVKAIGEASELTHVTILNLESGEATHPDTFYRVADVLQNRGIRFGALRELPGLVEDERGRRAPTRAAVGVLSGARLGRARNGLNMGEMALASLSRCSTDVVRKAERMLRLDQGGISDLAVTRIFVARFDRKLPVY